MKLLKTLYKRFEKRETRSNYETIIEDLETREIKLKKMLDQKVSESEINEYQKEYNAVKLLLCKSRKQLEKR